MATRLRTIVTLIAVLALALVSVAPAVAQEEPEYNRKTDNIRLVDHLHFPQGTDMYFQRREGRQNFKGEVIDTTKDLLFAGADASSAAGEPPEGTPKGVRIYDVTDPTNAELLVAIDCPGYHADVNVYENYLIQSVDSASSNTGCAPEFDPNGEDKTEIAGVRIYDITDPANPVVVGFVDSRALQTEPHNITVLPWAGLLYIAGSEYTRTDPRFAFVDLEDPSFPATHMLMNDISSNAAAECHDIGVAQLEDQDLAFCAAVEQTFIWDISDPRAPEHLSTVPLAIESIHHAARLAPDGETLVLNDELGGAAAATGCAPTAQDPLGALWFYDISDPSSPQLQGTFSTEEASLENPCTSHFFNFIPGTSLLTVGWYKSGMIVVDYGDLPQTSEHAVFEPVGGDYWSSYFWHGYIYGNSFGGEGTPDYGGDVEAGGVWITQLDGTTDVAPSPHDRGMVWSPWTQQLPEPEPAPEPAPEREEEAAQTALPTTGGGAAAALIGLAALGAAATFRRRSS